MMQGSRSNRSAAGDLSKWAADEVLSLPRGNRGRMSADRTGSLSNEALEKIGIDHSMASVMSLRHGNGRNVIRDRQWWATTHQDSSLPKRREHRIYQD